MVWDSTAYRLVLYGELEENIKGGANEVLLELQRQLTDTTIGATADITKQDPSPKRPGWRSFSIEVRFK
jgi:hypothetical protein